MMRLSARAAYSLLFLIAFVSLSVVSFPLSLALRLAVPQGTEISWRDVRGTIWRGQINEMSYGSYNIGNIRHRLHLLPLLTGTAAGDVTISGRAVNGRATLAASGNSIRINDAIFRVNMGAFGLTDPTDTLIRGVMELEIAQFHFTRKGCRQAELTVTSDALVYSARSYGAEGFVLTGPGRCDGDNLAVLLAGQSVRDALTIDALLQPNLDYTAEIEVKSTSRELGSALQLYGFQRQNSGHILVYRSNLLTRS